MSIRLLLSVCAALLGIGLLVFFARDWLSFGAPSSDLHSISEDLGASVIQESQAAFSTRGAVLVKPSGTLAADTGDLDLLLAKNSDAKKAHVGFPIEALREGSVVPPSVLSRAKTPSDRSPFVEPMSLKPAVDFWKKIFAVYGKDQVVLHHRDHLETIYAVLDFKAVSDPELGLDEEVVRRIRYRLIDVARGSVIAQERASNSKSSHDIQKNPALIRAQTGIRERFEKAVTIAATYMPYMEKIFDDEGLPVELTRLPFIESSFDIQAMSSVGALGIWQFMRDTGKLYLQIDDDVDERRDPLASTYAAAQFFKKMYGELGDWPLSVNAYNAGYGRMLQAVRQVGSKDIEKIIFEFKDPSYQFASRNFYPEFLAALSVYNDRLRYFPESRPSSPLRYDIFTAENPVFLPMLSQMVKVPLETLKDLNPALSESFWSGSKALPAELAIRVPYLLGDSFRYAAAKLSPSQGMVSRE